MAGLNDVLNLNDRSKSERKMNEKTECKYWDHNFQPRFDRIMGNNNIETNGNSVFESSCVDAMKDEIYICDICVNDVRLGRGASKQFDGSGET